MDVPAGEIDCFVVEAEGGKGCEGVGSREGEVEGGAEVPVVECAGDRGGGVCEVGRVGGCVSGGGVQGDGGLGCAGVAEDVFWSGEKGD